MRLNTQARRLLLAVIFLFVLWQIWSRVHIVIWSTFGDLLLLFVVLAIVFLLVDHYLNHGRS